MAGATATATLRINTVMDTGDVIGNINQIQGALRKLKMPKDLTSQTEAKFEELTSLVKEYQNLLDKPHKSNADLRQLDQLGAKIKKVQEEIEKTIRHLDFGSINFDNIHSEKIDELRVKLKKAEEEVKNFAKTRLIDKNFLSDSGKLKGELLTISNAIAKSSQRSKSRGVFSDITENLNTGNISKAIALTEQLKRTVNSGANRKENPIAWAKEAQPALESFLNSLRVIDSEISQAGSGFSEAKSKVAQLTAELKQAIGLRIDELGADANKIADGMSEAASATNTFHNSMSAAMHQQSEMASQIQNLQMQIKNYFGLDEIFRKIGDLARSAMDTVKELDAAMTETAVVTNFDVSDMWKMLPTYTKNANQLGSTIADVYNAATLYYQQGLTTTQSMDLANETLKMARIGGIEAAEATDMMTAALRGFNMEINQTSAQRINDVYSKLAAITAADTKEIGTAMERTASISKSANMDFETTSAFLAQMIETTREAPENLGTAMKTIVARFQEMKVDPNTLVDSEGERLDFNRVDKALKAVGISLVDEQNQFRNLDDVFLDISSHWDGMSQAQQRYIATIAAGSRQQSRFIAMMQDYDRTMELVDAAYTAEGAGQAQFEKTLESMDSKLNRLKNAWDQFAMGFMNADFLKVGVDAGTKFLDIFEKIITGISQIGVVDPFKSVIKSALTATAVFGGLLAMSKLLMAGVGKWAGFVLGDEAAKDMGGVVGGAYNMTKGEKAQKREDARKQMRELAREEAKIRSMAFKTGADDTEGGFIKKNLGARQAQLQYQNFSKELRANFAKGDLSFTSFDKAFSGLSSSVKSSLASKIAPAMSEAFLEAAGNANLSSAAQEMASTWAVEVDSAIKAGNYEEAIDSMRQHLQEEPSIAQHMDTSGMMRAAAPMVTIGEQFDKIGNKATQAGTAIQMFGANLQGTPLAPFGTALMVVGQGVENLGMLMSSGISKVKDWASSMTATGATVLKAGDSANKASKFFAGLGSSIISFLTTPAGIVLGIAAAVAAVGAAIYFTATAGDRALKRQGDAAAQASQDLDTAKQALEAVSNDLTDLANNDNALNGLVVGTTEWNNQLAQANAHIIEMMGNYKTLNEMQGDEYKYVKTDEDGRMSITQAGQDAIRKEYQNAVNLATANSAVQGALFNEQKDLNSAEYKRNQDLINRTNRNGLEKDADYKQAVLQNQNIEEANAARIENAWKTGIHAAISDLGLKDSSAMESILTSQRDALVENAKISSGLFARKENEEQYAELMGYERTGKGEYKDAQGNALSIDYDTVKTMLPELQAISDAQTKAAAVESSLISAQSSYNKTLEKEGSEQQKSIEGQESIISDILSSNADANLDAVEAFINAGESEKSGLEMFKENFKDYSESNAEILSNISGEEINSSSDYKKVFDTQTKRLEENAKNIIEQQKESISGVAGILSEIDWESSSADGQTISELVQSMSASQRAILNNVVEGMTDNLGKQSAETYAKGVADLIDQGKTSSADSLQDIFSGVDFSSSLQTIEAFGEATKSADENVVNIGKSLSESGDAARATAGALQEVYTSDDFSQLAEDMNEYINEQGQLDSSKILEMAESSSTLQRYLDATGGSAEGVARAFTEISKGRISFDDLTPGVVAAANAMEQLSVSAGRANQAIEKFEIKNDTGKYEDFITGNRDTIKELIDNAEYGNEAIQQVLSQSMGSDAWAGAFEAGADGIKDLYGEYNRAVEASSDDIKKLYDGLDEGEKNTEGLLKEIQKEYDVTADFADVMLQKATNYDVGLKKALQATSKSDMRKEYFTATGIKTGEGSERKTQQGYMGSAGDIRTQAYMYAGDDKEKQKEFIEGYAESLKGLGGFDEKFKLAGDSLDDWCTQLADASPYIANFKDEMSGIDIANEIQKNWREQFGKDEKQGAWWRQVGENEGRTKGQAYDVQSIIDYAQKAGLSQERATETAFEIAQEYTKQGEKFEYQGQELTAEQLESLPAFTQAIQEISDNSQWAQVGQTIGQAIVAAMQGSSIIQDIKNGNYGSAVDDKGLNETAFDGMVEAVKATTENQSQQQGIITDYLAQSKTQFEQLKPEQQTAALEGIVSKLNELNFTPEQIASTIKTGLGVDLGQRSPGTGTTPLTGEAGEVKLNADVKQVQDQLNNLEATPKLKADTETLQSSLSKLTGKIKVSGSFAGFSAKASGQNNPNSVFHRVGTMARGSKHGYVIPGRPTLTGEEGEELVWEPKRNQAYMVGSNGPQFANISRDAVVWNADQTKRIKKNSGSVSGLGTSARGIKNFGTMGNPPQKGGTAGGGGSYKIPGTFSADVVGDITKLNPPEDNTIPVKADLKIDKDGKGGFLNKIKNLFGKGEKKEGYKISVDAEVKKITVPQKAEKKVTVDAKLGQITGVANKKVKGVKATATVNKVTKGKKVSGEPIKVKAKATVTAAASTEGANAAIESAASKANTTQTMTIDGNNGPVMAKIQSAINKISSAHPSLSYSVSGPTSVTVDIWPRFQGSWVKTYTLKPSKARGQNYQKYNSYAGGRNLNSSKIKGETALTGEEGYEVVWLPKQNKSMIVGTQGPQMINLPPDAVIWPHDQSKKILNNNKGLPVNSFASGNTRYRVFKKKDKEQQREKISTSKNATSSKAFNLEQKILEVKRLQEEKQKELNKLLEKACVTFKDIEKVAKKDFKRLNDSVKLNKKLVSYYDDRLKKLNKTGKRTIEWSNPAQTRTRKNKNSDWKKWKSSGDKTHKASINLGNYIYRDEYGAYVVDYEKINKRIGKKDKNKAKAVKEAAEKEIKEFTSGKNSAEDDLEKAREEMKEIGKTMYDTFYAWENELTKIEETTRKIAELEEKITKLKSAQQLSDSILNAGYSLSNKLFDINAFRAEMQTTVNTIKKRQEAIGLQRQEIQNTISSKDEYEEYKEAKKAWQNTKSGTVERETEAARKSAAWDNYVAAEKSKKYIQATTNADGTINITINEDLLEEDKDYKNISTELYERIKKHYDKLVEQNNKLNELYESQTSALSELYSTLTNLREEYASHSEELLKGLESFEEEEANALQKLDSTISNTLKDIISEVRRSIDMRRRQEDNAKKEEDIFKKQQRLSALRASTGNNYAVEIAQLEKEIAEAQQSYGRDLEDQQLQILEDQGEKAAEQRERQIQILNSQLDYAKASGANIELIDKLLLNPDANREEIIKYWKKANNYDEATGKRKEVLDIQLEAFLEDLDLESGIPAKMDGVTYAIGETSSQLNDTLSRIENLVKATLDQVTLAKMRKAQGAAAGDLRKEGFGATTLRKAGYTATQLKEGNFSTKDIVGAGYNKSQLKQAGITSNIIKKWNKDNPNNKISASKIHDAGFTATEAHNMGYSDTEIRKGGYTIKEFKKYTGSKIKGAKQAKKAGYSNSEITDVYGSRIGMTQFGVSGKTAQEINGTSAKTLQTIINKSKGDKATQKDMAGVQVGKVDVNGKEKGGITKDSHISNKGTRVGANKGSTLYTADWDEKTGKVKGKWTAYTIDKLTTSLVKKYPIDAKQALEYAIKNTKVGSKINKDFGGLVKAAKIAGKTYKIKSGKTASLGSSGNIHYNGTKDKKDGVYVWDPAAGKIDFRKYNKTNFIKWAKDKNVGREYVSVLKKKKVKGFATGGLADYTGPAWLDGTPSKPELVLNAQDTQNFMALKDVLSRAIGSIDSGNQNSYNNANFEININVDHINNDYDVEKIAKKVKKEIVQSSNYRNVTQVRNLR